MKRLLLKIAIFLLVLTLFVSTIIAREPRKEQVLTQVLTQALEAWHYSPQKINDQFSERVYNLYLKSLDPNKRFFLKTDIDQLKQYQFKIDNQLKGGTSEFYDLSWNIFKKRVEEVNRLSQEILKKPFNFEVNQSLETDPAKRDYAANEKDFREQWRLYLKYQTLLAYLDLVAPPKSPSPAGGDNNQAVIPVQPLKPEVESQAREKVAQNLKRSFERLLKENGNRLDNYVNAVANSFDPHTEYLAPASKEDFDINMSGTLEGIGASLTEDGDYIKVVDIVPGSPAWRLKSLQAEDIILKVAQGDGEPVDVVGMPVNEAVRLIRGKKGTEVKLTVKKPDGQIIVIPIIRDVVVIEEAYAKSALIFNEKTGRKYGYINLPSFYRGNKPDSRNSADDVRKELTKLNAEKVDGVVLDLRNNGGGSLEDAVDMAGLFIKEGPIVQVDDSKGQKEILTDPDSSVVYNGPLVVLVNSLSASASEILAAALQDYGRAVIAGGPTTFGKGTVQVLADLDRYIPNNMAAVKPAGSLKLTIKKFYRINGGSTQWKGVTADIPLPDLYSYLGVGEKKLDYSLPWDTTAPAFYKKWTPKVNITKLKQLSAKRVASSRAFRLINADIARVKQRHENSLEPLNFTKFLKEQNQLRQEANSLQNLPVEQPNVKILNLKADQAELTGPGAQKTKDWYKQIGKDAYIDEAWHILEDMAG
ncbi:MAG: carboxy terminal-processing peptidase [Bacillota bacterium]